MTTTLAAHPTGPGPRAALRAEHTKFWSVRTLPGLAVTALVTAVVMALLFAVSLPITQGTAIADLAPTTVVEAALVGVDVAAVVLIVLGALFMGSEYSSGLAQPTFILTPRRGRVLLAKAAVTVVVAAGVALAVAALCLLVGQAVLLGSDLPGADLGDPGLLRLAAGSVLVPVFYALIALVAATLTRSTGGGIVAALVLLALPTVLGWLPGPLAAVLVPALPAAALHSISGTAAPVEASPAGAAAVLLLVWVAAGLGAAALRLRARDA